MKKNLMLLFAVILLAGVSCKKDDSKPKAPEFVSFSLDKANNPGLSASVEAVIANGEINIRVPNAVDASKAVPSFKVDQNDAIVYLDNAVQQSGTTEVDFNKSLTYRIESETTSNTYKVNALFNASILNFGFYKEDNEGVLFKDYEASIEGLSIQVDLPIGTDLTALVARFTLSSGAQAKVGGTTQTSEESSNDFSTTVSYTVSDNDSGTPENYEVQVGELTAPTWTVMSTGSIASKKVSTLSMAIHPSLNTPYLTYTIPSSEVDGDNDLRKIVVYGFDGSNWGFVGPEGGFSESRTDLSTIDFDSKGAIYAAYKDFDSGDKLQHASVKKFANNSWSYVGTQQFTDHRVNHLTIVVDKEDIPTLGYVLAKADAGMANRSPYTTRFENNSWTGYQVPGTTTAFFSRLIKGNNNELYYVAMDMTISAGERRPTVYQWKNNNWSVVGTPLITPAEDVYGAILIDAAVSNDGEVYLVFQSQPNTDKQSFVMHYDGSSWKQLGDEIDQEAGSNAERDNISLAVHPNGTLYFASADANGLYVRTLDKNTNNWTNPIQLTSTRVNGIDMKASKEGVIYLATTGVDDSNALLYKFDIPN